MITPEERELIRQYKELRSGNAKKFDQAQKSLRKEYESALLILRDKLAEVVK